MSGPDYVSLADRARAARLDILGGFHPRPDDGAPQGCETLLLLGPREPGFWPAFTRSPEFADGKPDPLDRWSERVVGGLAREVGAHALFPFGGPPYNPFFSWALRTGRCHRSPVHLLVHDRAGLFVSFRGALALGHRIALPPPPAPPCAACSDRPCLAACPVSAFGTTGYDVARCKAYLDEGQGSCMSAGCLARRACPASRGYGRLPEQSSFHMAAFVGK